MNFENAIKNGKLEIGGTLWQIIRNMSGVPFDVQEMRLEERATFYRSDAHILRFKSVKNGHSAYGHHQPNDWFETKEEAYKIAQESFNIHLEQVRRQMEEMEIIQQNLFNNRT